MTNELAVVPLPDQWALGSERLLPIAREALAAAERPEELRRLADEADVLRSLARKAELGRQVQNEWALYRLDAERKGGQALRALAAAGERASRGGDHRATSQPVTLKPTLGELGMGQDEHAARQRSYRWQQLAAIPDDVWGEWKATEQTIGRDVTQAAALRLAERYSIWLPRERDLLDDLRAGQTVVVSLHADTHLIAYAEAEGLFVRIDRRTDWGNPFLMDDEDGDKDGDRATVIANYESHYLPHKPSLLARLGSLRGKALGCWCAPAPCHGDVLKAWAADCLD